VIRCACTGQDLSKVETGSEATHFIQGQVAKVLFAFDLSSEWGDLDIIYGRFQHGESYDVALNDEYECEAPWEVFESTGKMNVCLRGESTDGRILTTNPIEYVIDKTIPGEGGEPTPATESMLQQVIDAAASATTAASSANTAADEANSAAASATTAASSANTAANTANTAASNATTSVNNAISAFAATDAECITAVKAAIE